jgi:NTE family protein
MADGSIGKEKHYNLFLFGRGYRATLFHLGALRRLNDFGLLPRLTTISSISGGSIAAGLLAARWDLLGFDGNDIARNFQKQIELDLLELTSANLIGDWPVIRTLRRNFRPAAVGRRYRSLLRTTLEELRNRPDFIFMAANLQNWKTWTFSREDIRDSSSNTLRRKNLSLATVVAASAAIQKRPVVLEWKKFGDISEQLASPSLAYGTMSDEDWIDVFGMSGLPTEDYLLVSDAGASALLQQVLERRRGMVHPSAEVRREGAYWDIATELERYQVKSVLNCYSHITTSLRGVPEDFVGISRNQQQDLIDWGFASCDAALRASFEDFRHNEPDASPHGTFYAKPPTVAELQPAPFRSAPVVPGTPSGVPEIPSASPGTPSSAPGNPPDAAGAATAA